MEHDPHPVAFVEAHLDEVVAGAERSELVGDLGDLLRGERRGLSEVSKRRRLRASPVVALAETGRDDPAIDEWRPAVSGLRIERPGARLGLCRRGTLTASRNGVKITERRTGAPLCNGGIRGSPARTTRQVSVSGATGQAETSHEHSRAGG